MSMCDAWKSIKDLELAAMSIKYHRLRLLHLGFSPDEVNEIVKHFVIDEIMEDKKNGKLDLRS